MHRINTSTPGLLDTSSSHGYLKDSSSTVQLRDPFPTLDLDWRESRGPLITEQRSVSNRRTSANQKRAHSRNKRYLDCNSPSRT
ncbi:hypothetical protein CY34DRAFT_283518 [Suillus luteus UH-Slu-Lm8-n1]|uniref:Uncharacterized protein n=1 Tax=Suillus luteus UH-Slu-Lm8-n1 TaxID=930992 RepID=A0A0D0B8X4_9AGAM|nr:hypothetical protein CY34DRAFT_283518 [Suillus luteus UH-Slu-Lm8-n1]